MWRFYWGLVKRVPALLWLSAGRLDKLISVGTLGLTIFGFTPLWPFSPLWALLPLGVLFVYGLMKANYEAFREIEVDRDQLRRGRSTREKRVAFKDALAAADRKGGVLYADNPSIEDAEAWATETAELIEAALGQGEVHLFAYASGVTLYGSQKETQQQLWIKGRLHRLGQLIARVDSLELRPEFNPDEWRDG